MLNKKQNLGLVGFLLESDAVTVPTAKALTSRLEEKSWTPAFFDQYTFLVLKTVTNLLLDQTGDENSVEIAVHIDERLAKGLTDGWRYDKMPQDGEMYLKGLKGIDETSTLTFNQAFIKLTKDQQIQALRAIQSASAAGSTWQEMSSSRFFEEILAETTEIFYAHPTALQEIEYIGMADAFGWKKIGLNQMEVPIKEK
jgi:gluconate 2-dehydrogenase gamma chain